MRRDIPAHRDIPGQPATRRADRQRRRRRKTVPAATAATASAWAAYASHWFTPRTAAPSVLTAADRARGEAAIDGDDAGMDSNGNG